MAKNLTFEDIFSRLVGFDTTSRESNMALITWVADYLSAYSVSSIIDKSPCGTKANLIATIGANVPGGLVLSGHSDVVPVDGQQWSSPPFTLTQRTQAPQLALTGEEGAPEAHYFGRGTADMKGFIAAVLARVPDMMAAGLRRPVHIVLTFDEEVGCMGIQQLLEPLKKHIAPPRLVVVGEPTSMRVATSHKGQNVYKVELYGQAAHSSRPQDGVNAVFHAAGLLGVLQTLASEARSTGPQDTAFDPPYTTLNVGPIAGGSAFNIVADYCQFEWDLRPVPADNPEVTFAAFSAAVARTDAAMKREAVAAGLPPAEVLKIGAECRKLHALPPLAARPGSDGESLALALAQQNHSEVVGFGTEAGHIQLATDWPVVVCGPGSIAQAHKADEFITASELAKMDAFLTRAIANLCQ